MLLVSTDNVGRDCLDGADLGFTVDPVIDLNPLDELNGVLPSLSVSMTV